MIIRPLVFCISKEMIDAGLKGNELVVYAYLDFKAYNMTGSYDGGMRALCDDLKITMPTAIRVVNSLVERGFVEKTYFVDKNKVRRCSLKPLK